MGNCSGETGCRVVAALVKGVGGLVQMLCTAVLGDRVAQGFKVLRVATFCMLSR
jgi:hypothetical protein